MNVRVLPGVLIIFLCTSCFNSNSSKNMHQSQNQLDAEVEKIQRALKAGKMKEACSLHLSIKKKVTSLEKLSPEILKELNQLQIKCGTRDFLIEFN